MYYITFYEFNWIDGCLMIKNLIKQLKRNPKKVKIENT